jgi:hypothetical protein
MRTTISMREIEFAAPSREESGISLLLQTFNDVTSGVDIGFSTIHDVDRLRAACDATRDLFEKVIAERVAGAVNRVSGAIPVDLLHRRDEILGVVEQAVRDGYDLEDAMATAFQCTRDSTFMEQAAR